MPQMMPMLWVFLFTLFIFIFIMIIYLTYYFFLSSAPDSTLNKLNFTEWSWKW